MNINDGLHGLPETSGVGHTARISAVQQKPQTEISGGGSSIQPDRTEVSTAASLAHQAMSVPDVRMDKVAAIQQALANGAYQVNPADVADKMIQRMTGE